MEYLKMILMAVVCYVIGGIPFGYLVGKLFCKIDIRNHGSGNIGATNIFRTAGWQWGILVLLLDILKAYISLMLVEKFVSLPSGYEGAVLLIFGLIVVLGHSFTIFLKFKGGKGVASSVGVFLFIVPKAIIVAIILFLITVISTKYVSLGSILGALLLPIFIRFFYPEKTILLGIIIIFSFLIILRHKSNIKRLINGTENKIYGNKKEN